MNEINQKNIGLYGTLISSSFEIECKPLISCLDDILKIFDDYLKLIAKNEVEIAVINNQIKPIVESKQTDLLIIYKKLDDLELFINCLKKNYLELEKKMELAESKANGDRISKINKLKSYFSLRKNTGEEQENKNYATHDETDDAIVSCSRALNSK